MIDWFTVVAQIVNFLILLALLKWLLFDRVVRAMDEREQKIASRLEDARHRQDEAAQRAERLEEERRELEAQREQMLQEAREEADGRRRELLREAREEVDRSRREWNRDLQRQQERFLGELSERAGEALQRAVRQALGELADADLQEGAVRVFLQKLEELDGDQRETLEEAIREADGRAVVASAQDLPEDARRNLAAALKRRFGEEPEVAFETSPELIAGLEVRAGGRALEWSLRRYLDEFEESVGAALEERLATSESASE